MNEKTVWESYTEKTKRKYMISVKNTERFSQNARQRENV